MSIKFLSHNPQETLIFAKNMAKERIPKGSTVLLIGEVGAGKTTFVRGFASNWQLETMVSSPTFTIMNDYSNGKVKLYHFDFYRLNTIDEIMEIGIEDFILQSDYSFIEWPEKALPLFNFMTVNIKIHIGSNEAERIFEIQ